MQIWIGQIEGRKKQRGLRIALPELGTFPLGVEF